MLAQPPTAAIPPRQSLATPPTHLPPLNPLLPTESHSIVKELLTEGNPSFPFLEIPRGNGTLFAPTDAAIANDLEFYTGGLVDFTSADSLSFDYLQLLLVKTVGNLLLPNKVLSNSPIFPADEFADGGYVNLLKGIFSQR